MLFEAHEPTGKLKKIQLDTHPLCALFEQEIVTESGDVESAIVVRYRGSPVQDNTSAADEKGMALRVPLEPNLASLEKMDVDLHGSPASAYRMGDAYDDYFSERFGIPTILVYLGDGRRAVLGKTLVPKPAHEEQQRGGWIKSLTSYLTGPQESVEVENSTWLSFTDVAPLMVASESSLRDVRDRLLNGLPVGMYKFRPNIVVDGQGEDAWAEDFWAELQIGAGNEDSTPRNTLQLTGNCVRCLSLNVDYKTGKPAESEEGNVLKKLMKDRRVDTGSKWSPVFGRYAFLDSHHSGTVSVSVGDAVDVTRRNAERSVWDWPGL